jgi:XTP/dITP diphosphohydrolase
VLTEPSVGDLLAAAADGDVVWLADDEEAERFPGRLATAIVDSSAEAGRHDVEVEVLHGSYDVPGARLLDLVTVMDRLRTDCPWDREQTHRSLAKYLLEESYETLEAIDSEDYVHLREELGDLLLQVFFHARVASEAEDGFTIDDVAGGIVDKLVHRHPHVFAGLDVADAEEVDRNWERLKAAEKGRASVLDGIPAALPALALADKVLGRAARVGVAPADPAGREDALGDRLLAVVVEARSNGLDAEQELRDAVRRLADTVRATEPGRGPTVHPR